MMTHNNRYQRGLSSWGRLLQVVFVLPHASLVAAPAYEALTDEIVAADATSQAVLSHAKVEQHACLGVRVLAE